MSEYRFSPQGDLARTSDDYRPLNAESCLSDLGSWVHMICLLATACCLLVLYPGSCILHP